MYYRTITRGKLHISRIDPNSGASRICGREKKRPITEGMKPETILRGLTEHRSIPICETCEEGFRNDIAAG